MPLTRISITVPNALVAAADRRARQLARSRSWVVAEALRAWLADEEPSVAHDAAADVAEVRRRHLLADLRLSPEERLHEAEEPVRTTGSIAVEVLEEIKRLRGPLPTSPAPRSFPPSPPEPAMSVGKEYLRVLHEALARFEEAVTARENPGLLTSKVSLQQDVDKARDRVVETVVNIVTQDRLARES